MGKYDGRIGMQFKDFELKELDLPSRKISGYAAVFGNVDKAGDKLVKGCFSKSIEERGAQSQANDKILLLWQHDSREPLGRITELREDDKGLYFEALIDEIELGDRALKQLESGTLNQFSIGFSYVWENCLWDEEGQCLVVKEVKLYEISVVSIGCNGETEYLGLKSATEAGDTYEELTREIAEVTKGMSVRRQSFVQHIISKAMSLASVKPEAGGGVPLRGGVADSGGEVKSLFKLIRIKER